MSSAPRAPAPPPHRPRRALSGLQGGAIAVRGDPAVGQLLARALDVRAGPEQLPLTHGFHSWPGRFHPEVPRRLLAGWPGARVLDPFAGSGTTLVEAALAGRAGVGVDANPLAVSLGLLKATVWPADARARLVAAADQIAEHAIEAGRAARRASSPKPPRQKRWDDPRLYAPHVYRELVTLREAIPEADEPLRGALLLVLSSIVVKVSLQRSDTDERLVDRAVGRGAAARHFAAKARELAARMADFAAKVPAGTPPPDLREGDARALAHLADRSIDLAISSPPYLGTYDYPRHHARRFAWLGIDPRRFAAREIGARRSGDTRERWARDVAAYVGELARVLRPGAHAFLLVGDSIAAGRPVPGDQELARAAERAGLRFRAAASQARPEVHAPRDRAPSLKREHLLAFAR